MEFDETVELPGHKGRYGVLFGSYGPHAAAWAETEGTVTVYVVEALPEDLNVVRFSDATAATQTHASYRVESVS